MTRCRPATSTNRQACQVLASNTVYTLGQHQRVPLCTQCCLPPSYLRGRPWLLVSWSPAALLAMCPEQFGVCEVTDAARDRQHHSRRYSALVDSARGVVFYGTPHFGSPLAAMGWRLRHLPGAAPAPVLAKLQPGPHLVELNEQLRQLHDSGEAELSPAKPSQAQPSQAQLSCCGQACACHLAAQH